MIAVFAEKPSVGREYAEILGATNKKDGFIEGNGYTVTWGFGHLVGLADAKVYDPKYKSWNINDLPIIPEKFKLSVTEKKQFNVIKEVFSKCDHIINGGDAGREGELIFRYIYNLTGCKKEVKRLWISSLTREAIEKGLNELKPGSDYDNTYYAGKARAEGDWLLGVNTTRALTLGAKAPTALSLGRVQTPVLAMLVSRYFENKNFSPVNYFVPQLLLSEGNTDFKITYKGKFEDEISAKELLSKIGQSITCSNSIGKEKKETQPYLFDITSLQREANIKLKFSAQKTLDLMQTLYEKHKVLTYPRTDSKYITEDVFNTLEPLFNKLKSVTNYAAFIEALDFGSLPKKSVNDSKVSDHHAIIPTGIISTSLDADEQLIFDMVTRQFIAAFSDVCIKDTVSLEFNEKDFIFTASGSIMKSLGWRALFSNSSSDDSENESNQLLPLIKPGLSVNIKNKETLAKKTKAPSLYSEASILEAMESAGKSFDDEEAKEAMKDCGLGRAATRAGIIETLLSRGYVVRSKNKLIPTDLGEAVYESMKSFDFASPEMTGQWEKKLNLIDKGKYSLSQFNEEIVAFTRKAVEDISHVAHNIKFKTYDCPICKSSVKLGKFQRYCSKSNKVDQEVGGVMKKVNIGCKFSVPYLLAGKKISDNILEELIDTGKISKKITGFKKKDGSGTFDAFLVLNHEGQLKFDFTAESIGKCPKCKEGDIVDKKVLYGCSKAKFEELEDGKKKNIGCNFTIWQKLADKKISSTVVKMLINGGKSGVIKGFKKKDKKDTFDAMLKLNDDYTVGFDFPKTRKKKV